MLRSVCAHDVVSSLTDVLMLMLTLILVQQLPNARFRRSLRVLGVLALVGIRLFGMIDQ